MLVLKNCFDYKNSQFKKEREHRKTCINNENVKIFYEYLHTLV